MTGWSVLDAPIIPQIEKADEILSRMREGGVPPDVTTYTTIMSGCKRESDWRRAEALLAEMESFGIKPNSRTLTAVLKVCVFLWVDVSACVYTITGWLAKTMIVGVPSPAANQSPRWNDKVGCLSLLMAEVPMLRASRIDQGAQHSFTPSSSHHATPHLLHSLPFPRIRHGHDPNWTD